MEEREQPQRRGTPRAVLRLRTLAPAGSYGFQREIIDRLDRLDERNELDGFETDVWGAQIPVGSATEQYETYREFESWADRHGVSLAPAFERREIGSLVAEETHEAIVPPLVCLALYDRDDEVRAVYPHADGDRIYTVADGVEGIDGAIPEPVREEESDTTTEDRGIGRPITPDP